jgi:hypothetical protein
MGTYLPFIIDRFVTGRQPSSFQHSLLFYSRVICAFKNRGTTPFEKSVSSRSALA